MNAALLIDVVLGVTVQQVAKKAYNQKVHGGTFTFSAMSVLFALVVFVITSKGDLHFTAEILPYCLGFALSYSLACIGSFLAIKAGPLSITSLIVQYSLVIPTFYGLLFLPGETASVTLIVGLVLLFVSLFLVNMEGTKKEEKKMTLKWGIYALLAFLGNGICSAVQKAQQIKFEGQYKSELMIIALAISVLGIGAAALITERKQITANLKTASYWYIICGLANGLVNLFVLILSNSLPASVMFPIISAGGIIATAIIAVFFYKEKMSKQQIVGFVLGTVSIVFLNL